MKAGIGLEPVPMTLTTLHSPASVQIIVLFPSVPQTLSFTPSLYQRRKRSHFPVSQVQSLKETTVIGQLGLESLQVALP